MTKRLASIEPHCMRQFIDPDYKGPKIYLDPAEFERRIDKFLRDGATLHDGFAPFCKHIFVPNFAYLKASYLEITSENAHHMRTSYDANSPEDLPVLTRFFPAEAVSHLTTEAKFLDVILYSREEIHRANEASGHSELNKPDDAPWGIVRVKAQCVDSELPMLPSTMLKNALKRDVGGIDFTLNKEKYREAVAFWSRHAPIR